LLVSARRTVTDTEFEFIFDGRKRQDILRYFWGELSAEEMEELGHQKEAFFREEATELEPIRGVRQFLIRLRLERFKLAVASAGSNSRVHHVLEQLRLRDYFEAVVSGDDVSPGKPDPAIFRLASVRLGVNADNMVVFEDSVSGIKAAKAAGMKCVGIANQGCADRLLAAGADQVVADFVALSIAGLRRLVQ